MLLSDMLYSQVYKPYILKNNSLKSLSDRFKNDYRSGNKSEVVINQNKSIKNDVVSYMKSFSQMTNEIKESAGDVARTLRNYKRNLSGYGKSEANEWVKEDLESFLAKYNKLNAFSKNQSHSYDLKNLTDSIYDALNDAGSYPDSLIKNTDGEFTLDETKLNSNLSRFENDVKSIFEDINYKINDFFTTPLSSHMNFKGSNYIYNYRLGKFNENTYSMIDSGILIDVVC